MKYLLLGCCLLAAILPLHAQDINNVPAPSSFAEDYRAALIAYKNGEYKTAREEAQKAQKLKADDPKLKILQGRIALELGEYPLAEKLVKAGLEAAPDYTPGYEYLGDVYFRQRQYVPAMDAYQQFLKLRPKDPDGVLKMLYCHVGRNDLSGAGKQLILLDQFSDLHPGYYFGKAAIAQASKKVDAVDKDLQLARTMYGNDTFATHMKTFLILFPAPKPVEEKK